MPRNIMRAFKLQEISAVDRPAQQGARMAIMKRDYSADERKDMADSGEAMPDGSFPIKDKADLKNAIRSIGRASNAAAAKRHIIRRARALGATDLLPDDWGVKKPDAGAIAKYVSPMIDGAVRPAARTFEEVYRSSEEQRRQWEANEKLWPLFSALEESLRSITADSTLAAEGKTSRIQESVDAFMEAVKRELPDVEQELAKLLAEDPATAGFFNAGKRAGDHVQRKENTMPDDVKKVADLEASVTKLTTDLAAMQNRAEGAELLAKMDDAERAYFSKMSDKDKEEWAKLTPEEKKRRMEAAKSADDVVYKAADGTEFRKSDDPRLITMAKRADESERIAKAEREARETAEFTKRAETEAGNLPGDATLKGRVLKHLAGADKEVREAGEMMLKAGDKAIAKAFNRIGKTGGKAEEGSAEAQLDAMIEKHVTDHKVSKEVATAAVMKSAEGNRLYQEAKAAEPTATAH